MTAHLQFIAVTFVDGSVGIMAFHLAPRVPGGTELPGYDPKSGRREATDEAIRREIDKSSFDQDVISWRRMEVAEAMGPADRTYRDAWIDRNGTIAHDIAKAKEIYRDILRLKRKPGLDELDVQYFKAIRSEMRLRSIQW